MTTAHTMIDSVAQKARRVAIASALVAVACLAFAPRASAQGETIVNEDAKLLASDGAAANELGWSTAISGDTTVVGAPFGNTKGDNVSGSAYVFVRTPFSTASGGEGWAQQAKLLASDGAAGDFFGASVAIIGDTAIVGAPDDDDNGNVSGSAYVFVRNAKGLWTQQAKLLPSDGAAGDFFGYSVAINGDAAVVGAPNGGPPDASAAYVFVQNADGVWSQQAQLHPEDASMGSFFGASVAINADTAVIGSPGDFAGGEFDLSLGSAFAFTRDAAGVWTQQATLVPDEGILFKDFGSSVALSGDTVVVGAPATNSGGSSPTSGFGSAFAFVRDAAGVWTQQARLLTSDNIFDDNFGNSVAISGDTAVVGAPFSSEPGMPPSGSAYVFARDANGAWTQQDKLLASDGGGTPGFGDDFGWSATISGDTAIIGAIFDDDNGMLSGAAYVFNLSPDPSADLNADGVVDGYDLAALLTQLGANGASADLNGDGVVNSDDLAQLLTNWGPAN